MVENQHRLMKTYRDLSESEIELINEIKDAEAFIADLYFRLRSMSEVDQRWNSIARTHLQEGFSAFVRSIARPDNPFED